MRLGILRQTEPGEMRVAGVPDTVKRYIKAGLEVVVESQAGAGAGIDDAAYRDAGATVLATSQEVWQQADIALLIAQPQAEQVTRMRQGQVIVCPLAPRTSDALVRQLAQAGVTSFALDMLPRISRAQSMDVLSSMSTLAGYKAVLKAADRLPRLFPMMMTAAGTVHPATVLVIGAGVAGLQAIATARRLGAQVRAVDTRPVVKEQVESLGARFVAMEVTQEAEDTGGYARDLGEEFYRAQQEFLAPHVKGADVIVSTALIPGRRAPVLITEAMVGSMKPGSIVMDLAGIAGGNCAVSRLGEEVVHQGVRVLAPENLPAEMPTDASWMFSRNVQTFVQELLADGALRLDMDNEVIRGTMITHQGRVVHEEIVAQTGGSGAPAGPTEPVMGAPEAQPSDEAPEVRDLRQTDSDDERG